MPKKVKEPPFGIFQHPFCRKTPEKLKGDPFGNFFPNKKLAMPKKLKGETFGLVRYSLLRGKHFWFSSLGQQVQLGVFLKFCRNFGRTVLVTSGVSKNKPASAQVGAISKAQKHQKCQSIGELRTLLWIFFRKKVSQCRKKTERGDHLGFFTIHFVQKYQKIEGGTLRNKKFFEKTSHRAENTLWPR